jgi:hypothetical protein
MSTLISLNNTSPVVFVQTAASPVINGTSQQSLISTGIGSVLIPEKTLVVGSTYKFSMEGSVEDPAGAFPNGFKIEIGFLGTSPASLVGATGLQFLNGLFATTFSYQLQGSFTVNAVGGPGGGVVASSAFLTIVGDNSGLPSNPEVGISTKNNTTFDTTVNNTFEITVGFIGANPTSKINSRSFVLEKIK